MKLIKACVCYLSAHISFFSTFFERLLLEILVYIRYPIRLITAEIIKAISAEMNLLSPSASPPIVDIIIEGNLATVAIIR